MSFAKYPAPTLPVSAKEPSTEVDYPETSKIKNRKTQETKNQDQKTTTSTTSHRQKTSLSHKILDKEIILDQ